MAKSTESNAITDDSFEKVAKDANIQPEKGLDYRQVDQGRNIEPVIQSAIPPKVSKGKGKGKGKGNNKKVSEKTVRRTVKDEAHCSFCNNLMTQSDEMNWHPESGVKSPKNADGTNRYNPAPGAPAGKLSPVLCDDCERALKSGTSFRDFRTIPVERADTGKIENIAVTDLTR